MPTSSFMDDDHYPIVVEESDEVIRRMKYTVWIEGDGLAIGTTTMTKVRKDGHWSEKDEVAFRDEILLRIPPEAVPVFEQQMDAVMTRHWY